MFARKFLIAISAFLFLTGFDAQKREFLVENCVAHGNKIENCQCAIKLHEKMVGAKFLEAMYLELTQNLPEAQRKLMEAMMENPNTMKLAADADMRGKEECGVR